eukprot:4120725-Heterocapsa_arctica.AAC.1
MALVRASHCKQLCKMTPPKGPVTQLPVTGGYRRLPMLTCTYWRVWPPPNKDFKQKGRSQQQINNL